MNYKFFDTCSLLAKAGHIFDDKSYKTIISSITLQELEDIKTSARKDVETKFAARQVLRELNEHSGEYEIHIYREEMAEPISKNNFIIANDTKILACAYDYDYYCHPDETIFVTNDLALKTIANCYFGDDSIESVGEETLD